VRYKVSFQKFVLFHASLPVAALRSRSLFHTQISSLVAFPPYKQGKFFARASLKNLTLFALLHASCFAGAFAHCGKKIRFYIGSRSCLAFAQINVFFYVYHTVTASCDAFPPARLVRSCARLPSDSLLTSLSPLVAFFVVQKISYCYVLLLRFISVLKLISKINFGGVVVVL